MGKMLEFKPRDSDYWAKRIGATVMNRAMPDMEFDSEMRPLDSEEDWIEAMLKMTEALELEEGRW